MIKRILFVFAHPDDPEIYSGGLLSKICNKYIIEICIVFNKSDMQVKREKEALSALGALGYKLIFLNMPDDCVQDNYLLDQKMKELFQSFSPDLIITHNPNDYHTDHVSLSNSVKRIASYRSPVLYTDTLCGDSCEPDHYCDITDFMSAKLELIQKHVSQIELYDYVHICEIVNRFRGVQYFGVPDKYCEAYCLSSKYHYGQIRQLIEELL